MVFIISRKRQRGITKVSSSFGTSRRAEGSSMPRKQRLPPSLFSFTAMATMLEQPEPNGVLTASDALLS